LTIRLGRSLDWLLALEHAEHAVGDDEPADGFLNELLLVIAIAFGTINVVGGFLVTDRMLGMFKGRKPDPKPEAADEHG